MQVKIANIHPYTTNKAGEPLTGQWGPYVRLSAQFEGYQGWHSCNVKPDHPATHWKTGQTVEVETLSMKNGYPVFTLPKRNVPMQTTPQLGKIMEQIFGKLNEISQKLDLLTTAEEPESASPDEFGKDEMPSLDTPF